MSLLSVLPEIPKIGTYSVKRSDNEINYEKGPYWTGYEYL